MDVLEKNYRAALEDILVEVKKFDDLWDNKPETEVVIISTFTAPDEELRVVLRKMEGIYGFSANRGHDGFYGPEKTAAIIRSETPGGSFSSERWVDAFYAGLAKSLGEYLAEKVIRER